MYQKDIYQKDLQNEPKICRINPCPADSHLPKRRKLITNTEQTLYLIQFHHLGLSTLRTLEVVFPKFHLPRAIQRSNLRIKELFHEFIQSLIQKHLRGFTLKSLSSSWCLQKFKTEAGASFWTFLLKAKKSKYVNSQRIQVAHQELNYILK